MDLQRLFKERQTRRSVLRRFGVLAGMSLALDACSWNNPFSMSTSPSMTLDSIKHVVIACQENHTFDQYFGYYSRASKFGMSASYSNPDGKGGTVKPYHFQESSSGNPDHSWQTIHSEWNNGAMNGFYIADSYALGYYDRSDLPLKELGRL